MRAPIPSLRAARALPAAPAWLGADAGVVLPRLHPTLRERLRRWRQRLRRVLGVRRTLLALGGLLAFAGLGSSTWIHAKAALAQVLLRQAWSRTLANGAVQPPWPWADTWPVARLRVHRLGVDQIVLAGASGRTLAFGPGMAPAAAVPGASGTSVISGHRDTHFAFLRELAPGDRVWIETPEGDYAYEVLGGEIADARHARLDVSGVAPRLALVTCYPFDAVAPGGPLRYVVSARLVAARAPARADEA